MRSTPPMVAAWFRRLFVVSLVAGAALVGLAGPATAHGQLAQSDPVAGSRVAKPLQVLTLYFTEQPANNAHFTLTSPSGARVDTEWTYGQPIRLDKPVQELFLVDGKWEPRSYPTGFPAVIKVGHWPEKGEYTASYLSIASDAEPVRGTLKFSYTGPVTRPLPGWAAPSNGPDPALLAAIARGSGEKGDGGQGATTPTSGPDSGSAAGSIVAAPLPAAESGGWKLWLLPAALVAVVAVVLIGAARRGKS